jgi:hypothetical protein
MGSSDETLGIKTGNINSYLRLHRTTVGGSMGAALRWFSRYRDHIVLPEPVVARLSVGLPG